MPELQDLLRAADRIPAPDLWGEIETRPLRRLPQRPAARVLVAVVAIALVGASLVFAVQGFLGDQRSPTPASPPISIRPRISAEVRVGPFPSEVAVGDGAVWVTVNDPEASDPWYLARVDPLSNSVTDRIPILDVVDVAVGEGSVWAIGRERGLGSAVFQIDPGTGETLRTTLLDCGARCFPSQVAVGAGSVWVTASGDYPEFGYLIRLDPGTGRVIQRERVRGDPRDLVVDETGAWLYSLTHFGGGAVQGGTLYRFDARTGLPRAPILEGRVPPISGISGPPVLASGFGYLWTSVELDPDGERAGVVRIDPQTGSQVGEPIPLPPGSNFYPFATELGAVWFRGGTYEGTPSIFRIDPSTLEIEEVLDVDFTVLDGGIDAGSATIWATQHEGFLTRIDLR